jgi:hypothetical protein
MTIRRRAGVALALVALVIGIVVWAVPNLAGPALVGVRLLVTPVAGETGARERRVTVDGGDPVDAGALRLVIRLEGHYPLPVVVEGTNPPLRVELLAPAAGGGWRTLWALTGSAAELETGSDSPDGPGSPVIAVWPGALDLTIGPESGIALRDDAAADLPAGTYRLQAWALGIQSDPVSLTVSD